MTFWMTACSIVESSQGGHSGLVTMRLLVNGYSIPVRQMGRDFLLIGSAVNHPPLDFLRSGEKGVHAFARESSETQAGKGGAAILRNRLLAEIKAKGIVQCVRVRSASTAAVVPLSVRSPSPKTVRSRTWFVRWLNPKSEIKTANLPQSIGHKWIEKISPDRFGYGFDFFDSFLLQHLAASLPFWFRISG
jgi:hypothetical protein